MWGRRKKRTSASSRQKPNGKGAFAVLGKWAGRLVALAGWSTLALLICILGLNLWVVRTTGKHVYHEVDPLPENQVALVLGTSWWAPGGRTNPFFQYRMEAAAELYRVGKVRHLLVSGDNRFANYNEPIQMRRHLISLGVPAESITMDFAGFRTLDSIVRAQQVFGLSRFTIVSQANHNHRAVFLARHRGVDAVAFSARGVKRKAGLRVRMREVLARVKAIMDLYVLDTEPALLGEPEIIPLEGSAAHQEAGS